MLAQYNFLPFGHIVHPHDHLVVVPVGQRNHICQLVDVGGFEDDATEFIFEELPLHNGAVEIIEFSVHFAYLHLFLVYLFVDEVAGSCEDAPEEHAIPHLLSLALYYLLAFGSEVVHQIYSFLPCFQSVFGEGVSEFAECES